MTRRRAAALALVLLALMAGALVAAGADWTPSRAAHDRVWRERMLEGRLGRWFDTGEPLPESEPGEDRVASNLAVVPLTRYALSVSSRGWRPLAGDWLLGGGLVGRAPAGGGALELFAKEVTRLHWPMATARYGRDYAYELFLVWRPPAPARARVVRQWHIPPGDVALRIDPAAEAELRRTVAPRDLARALALNTMIRVEARLDVDPARGVATVSASGLTRPFAERIELAEALGAAR